MNCNDAVAALIDSLESGGAMTDEQREHIRTCARCRELLDSAKQFQSELEEQQVREPEVDAAVVEKAVRREHVKSIVRKVAIGIAVWASLFVAVLLNPAGYRGFGMPELLIATVFVVLALGPIVILYAIVRGVVRRRGKVLYRRLHPARWWLGVCVGLSEVTGIDRGWIRAGFLILTFFDGVGLLLYIVMALAMPVHPADREYLWRFQAKKMLERLRGRSA